MLAFSSALRTALRAAAPAEREDLVAPSLQLEPAAYPDAQEMLRKILEQLNARGSLFTSGLRASPKVSVTYGSAGVAYGIYRIACAQEDSGLLAHAD